MRCAHVVGRAAVQLACITCAAAPRSHVQEDGSESSSAREAEAFWQELAGQNWRVRHGGPRCAVYCDHMQCGGVLRGCAHSPGPSVLLTAKKFQSRDPLLPLCDYVFVPIVRCVGRSGHNKIRDRVVASASLSSAREGCCWACCSSCAVQMSRQERCRRPAGEAFQGLVTPACCHCPAHVRHAAWQAAPSLADLWTCRQRRLAGHVACLGLTPWWLQHRWS
jgi:hypothetical protein